MDKHIEKEHKLIVDKIHFDALYEHFSHLKPISQINYYYDTINHDILNSNGVMRIRTIGDKHLFTLKLFEHGDLYEYECFVDGNTANMLLHEDIQNILKELNFQGPFQLIGELKTIRSQYIEDNFELCFDINHYKNIVDYEIEYEYRCDHDGFTNFNKILAKVNLSFKENSSSKSHRALLI